MLAFISALLSQKTKRLHLYSVKGSGPTPLNRESEGLSVRTHGQPKASAWRAAGIVVSVVEAAIRMSTFVFWIRSAATVPAKLASDCVSLTTTLMGCALPSAVTR